MILLLFFCLLHCHNANEDESVAALTFYTTGTIIITIIVQTKAKEEEREKRAGGKEKINTSGFCLYVRAEKLLQFSL